MDISFTTAPDSTQINAEDFIGISRTVTVVGVRSGTAEQPVNIDLAEYPGRSYRPGKSMRRVIVAAWGSESDAYIGRRMTLYCDPEIAFGPTKTGGIRISEMSHIGKPITVALTVKRGKRAPFTVQPLVDAPAIDITTYTPALEQATNVDALKDAFFAAPPAVREDPRFIAAKDAKKAELAAQGQEAGA